jgi:hypothetical protein
LILNGVNVFSQAEGKSRNKPSESVRFSPALAQFTMTIFGFNTNVKFEEVVYHVQSEARQADLLLQTLVFVNGQCVGKRTTSYAQKTIQPGFTEDATHELLKAQHKTMVDTIQHGNVAIALTLTGEVEDIEGHGLSLKWVGSPALQNGTLAVKIVLTEKDEAVRSAQVRVLRCVPGDPATILTAITDGEGQAELAIPISAEIEADQAVIIQGKHGEKLVTRKLRFKK